MCYGCGLLIDGKSGFVLQNTKVRTAFTCDAMYCVGRSTVLENWHSWRAHGSRIISESEQTEGPMPSKLRAKSSCALVQEGCCNGLELEKSYMSRCSIFYCSVWKFKFICNSRNKSPWYPYISCGFRYKLDPTSERWVGTSCSPCIVLCSVISPNTVA